MTAKHVTDSDKQALYAAYRENPNNLNNPRVANTSRFWRLLDHGLIERNADNPFFATITPRGLQEIQSLIDKAAADKAAREAAEVEYNRRRKEAIENLYAEISAAGIDLFAVGDIIVYPPYYEVSFNIALCVRYSSTRQRYEPQIYKHGHYFHTTLDIDALIREAQDARTVAGILNGMLEQGEATEVIREPIPDYVIRDLAGVREIGVTNMLDKKRVLLHCTYHTEAWLDANPNRYMEALKAMGEWVSKREGEQS